MKTKLRRCSYCGKACEGPICSERLRKMVPAPSVPPDSSSRVGLPPPIEEMVPEDTLLMRDLRRGLDGAIEEFTRRSRCIPRIVASLNRRIGRALDEHEQADVCQDVLLTVWEKAEAFDGKASLEGWIYRIAFLKVMNRGRKKSRRSVVGLGLEPDELGGEEVVHPMEFEALHDCLEALPDREGNVVRMKHFDDLTFEEIADSTQTSTNTLKTQYYRARLRLEDCLRRAGHEEGEQ